MLPLPPPAAARTLDRQCLGVDLDFAFGGKPLDRVEPVIEVRHWTLLQTYRRRLYDLGTIAALDASRRNDIPGQVDDDFLTVTRDNEVHASESAGNRLAGLPLKRVSAKNDGYLRGNVSNATRQGKRCHRLIERTGKADQFGATFENAFEGILDEPRCDGPAHMQCQVAQAFRRRRNQPGLVHGQKSRAYRHLIRSRVIVQVARLCEGLARIHRRPREHLADGKIVN
jgi:hypothetical protein